MPASRSDDPTLDPVERERQILFGDSRLASGGSAITQSDLDTSRSSRMPLLSKLAIAVSVGLVFGYLLLWAQVVQQRGGPESYVRATDFVSTLTGATIIREGNGTQLYDLDTQLDAQYRVRGSLAQQGDSLLPYNHLPFEALLIAAMMDLPFPAIFAVWTLMAGLSIGLSLGMLDGTLPGARPLGWVLSMAACSYLPLMRALMLGQNSPLVLVGLCATYALLKRGQQGWAGAALLLVALKPQLLPLVGLLMLLQGYWRSIVAFVALLAIGSAASMLVLGPGWPLQYLGLLIGVADWGNTGAIDPGIMHNWRGLGTHIFGAWAPALVTPFLALMSLLSVALLVWTWYRGRETSLAERNEQTDEDEDADSLSYRPTWDMLWALAVVLSVLISPHLNPHDLTLLIFPGWIIASYAASGIWSKGVSRLWGVLLVAGYLVFPVAQVFQGQIAQSQPAQADSGNAALAVVPSVLLMAAIAWLLSQQIASRRATAAELTPV